MGNGRSDTARLFNHDFTLLCAEAVISALSDVAMSFIFSVIIYQETASTLLSGIFFATSFLPNIVVPVLLSPWVDNHRKKPFLFWCNAIITIGYFIGYMIIRKTGFNYIVFMLFDLTIGCVGAVYQIAYQAYFPSVIEEGLLQKGYTVAGMIYPAISVIVTPVAAVIYGKVGLLPIMLFTNCGLLITTVLTAFLREQGPKKTVQSGEGALKTYIAEIKFAISYLKKEKGLNRWYYYQATSGATFQIRSLMISAWFIATPSLGVALYGFLSVAQFAGRSLGSIFNYNVKYKPEHKGPITLFVYSLYNLCDTIVLFLPYTVMLITNAICGFLGSNTAVLRESAVMNYIPETDRGKINGLLQIRNFVWMSLAAVIGGSLGDLIGIRQTMLLAGGLEVIGIIVFVAMNLKGINAIFTSMPPEQTKAKIVL